MSGYSFDQILMLTLSWEVGDTLIPFASSKC